ncbi:MAG: type IV-A pilus assembly ATPase PilB [Syntrophorhabdales bacterium]|jgi:type IV pilus assembly protein PilB
MDLPIGDLLVTMGHISKAQLAEALDLQKEKGGKLGQILVSMGAITEEEILKALSIKFVIPMVDLNRTEVSETVIKMIPLVMVRRFNVMPISRSGNTLCVAISDPTRVSETKALKLLTGCEIQPFLTTEVQIEEAIEKHYEAPHALDVKNFMSDLGEGLENSLEVLQDEATDDVATLESDARQPPVVRIVNHCFLEAIKGGASDIHIEPYEDVLRVRFRIDGALYEVIKVPIKYRDGVLSRVKVLSKLDISEKRIPQDGRIKLQVKVENRVRNLDVRVSTTPTLFGEKIVMRLLDKEGLMLDMGRLGFEEDSLKKFEEAIFKPWGMVLVTGPTGSGKTNTLYSAISRLNTTVSNIMTVEDPVEFNIYGINQVQVHESIDLTFASVLRSFLRQDPNIILVGEVRDNETAAIAVKAALTGHLVLSTLHTNDAPSAVSRLVDMDVDPFLVATSVILVAAQRLVRRICSNCKEEVTLTTTALLNIGFSEEEAASVKIYAGRGCNKCNNTGYKGRVGLYEVMPISEKIRELIFASTAVSEIRKAAIEEGMLTLRQSGLTKIKQGITTMEEVFKETF